MASIGPESMWAAEAAECANAQGKFWPYHDKVFQSQRGENRGAFSKDNLKRFAADLDLDTASFNSCLDSDRYAQKVKDDIAEGERMGVQAFPTFFINGTKIEGVMPLATYRSIIEEALNKAQ